MSLRNGVKDGAIVGLALMLYFAFKNFDKLTLFGGKGLDLYPKLDGKNTTNKIGDPMYFDPDKNPDPNNFSLEMLALQKLANKYLYFNIYPNQDCVLPPQGSGPSGFIYPYIPETGFYNSKTQTSLFNRYNTQGIPTYRQFRDHIKKNIGEQAFKKVNCRKEQQKLI